MNICMYYILLGLKNCLYIPIILNDGFFQSNYIVYIIYKYRILFTTNII